MKIRVRFVQAFVLLCGWSVMSASAWAQGMSSLGGYGGSISTMGPSSGSAFVPYTGMYGGFLPYRMGGASSLSFQPRGTSSMESTRPSFSLSPMTGGMASNSGGMGSGSLSLARMAPMSASPMRAFGSGKVGTTMQSTTGRMGVMPPNFGYPFSQPAKLFTSPAAGMGMGM